MINYLIKLFFFILLNAVICNTNLYANFSIDWTEEKSGIIRFDADKYSDTDYEISFNEQLFVKKKFTLIGFPDGSEINENFFGFSQKHGNENLFSFVHMLRTLAISNKYFLSDASILFQKGVLTEGKDYAINKENRAKITGKTNFILEHTDGNYRSTVINNIVLDTDWSSGKQEIRILLE